MMTYKVVLTHTEEGYSVGCPELPGCWSEGETEAEALSNIRVAIQEYVSVQPTAASWGKVTFVDVTDVAIPHDGKNGAVAAVQRKPFDFGTLQFNLPPEWTSHKVEDLLDILEGPDRR
jgi:predicted RNase H-like HicB family nuclease